MSTRPRIYRTEAVVLRRMDLGETDRLLTLLTPDAGKLRAIAKGVRRPGSRKAGHLEPFCRTRLLLARGRQLDIITQAEAVDLFDGLGQDLERLGAAAHLVELIDRFTVEETGSHAVYDLLVSALGLLSRGADLSTVSRYYELRLLDLVGFRPELFHCVSCRREIQAEDQFFASGEGGVLCPACGRRHERVARLPLAVLKVLRHYQRHPYELATAAAIRPQVLAQLEDLMEAHLTYLAERKLNAPHFLRTIRALPKARVDNDATA